MWTDVRLAAWTGSRKVIGPANLRRAVRRRPGKVGPGWLVYLGHRSLDVTRIYAEDDLERAREVARRFG